MLDFLKKKTKHGVVYNIEKRNKDWHRSSVITQLPFYYFLTVFVLLHMAVEKFFLLLLFRREGKRYKMSPS